MLIVVCVNEVVIQWCVVVLRLFEVLIVLFEEVFDVVSLVMLDFVGVVVFQGFGSFMGLCVGMVVVLVLYQVLGICVIVLLMFEVLSYCVDEFLVFCVVDVQCCVWYIQVWFGFGQSVFEIECIGEGELLLKVCCFVGFDVVVLVEVLFFDGDVFEVENLVGLMVRCMFEDVIIWEFVCLMDLFYLSFVVMMFFKWCFLVLL